MELKRDWLVKQAHLARSYQISSAISSVKSYLSQIRRSKINPMGVCPLSRPRLQCHLVWSHSPGHSRCKSPLYCGSAHLSSPSLSSDRLPYFTWRTFYTVLTRGSHFTRLAMCFCKVDDALLWHFPKTTLVLCSHGPLLCVDKRIEKTAVFVLT